MKTQFVFKLVLLSTLSLAALPAHAEWWKPSTWGKPKTPPRPSVPPVLPGKKDVSFPLMRFPYGDSPGWKITRTRWEPQDEIEFGEMVQEIAADRQCQDAHQCLARYDQRHGNKLPTAIFWSDCAKFPYLLRAYYAYTRGLPFRYVNDVDTNPLSLEDMKDPTNVKQQNDPRYAPQGNRPTSAHQILTYSVGRFPSLANIMDGLQSVWSATFRISPEIQPETANGVYQDFYSVKLSREALVPGTIIYNPNGHVVLISQVDYRDGVIHHVGAGIGDGAIMRNTWGNDYPISRMAQGGGFKRFRPLELVGAQRQWDGSYVGGRIVAPRNEELWDYGIDQYQGNSADGSFQYNGRELSVYDYVRFTIVGGTLKLNPIREFSRALNKVCVMLQDRVKMVAKVPLDVVNGLHPAVIPANIFSGDETWEAHSSPGRDLRLKVAFAEAMDVAYKMKQACALDPNSLNYDCRRQNLRADLVETYYQVNDACRLSYAKSDGRQARIDLDSMNERLFLMSFDPYHCPERRWGATGQELRSCSESWDEAEWYDGEQGLRDMMVSSPGALQDLSLQEIFTDPAANPLKAAGQTRPNLNLRNFLDTL